MILFHLSLFYPQSWVVVGGGNVGLPYGPANMDIAML